MNEYSPSDILIKDTICPICGGQAAIIFPRSKPDLTWPTMCFWCGDTGFITTGLYSQVRIQRTKQWADAMLDILSHQLDDRHYVWTESLLLLKEAYV